MGQKTHPLGFRLGITQKHKSAWFSKLSQYSVFLKEDDKIRTYFKTLAKTASISEVQINRNTNGDLVELTIESARPGVIVGKAGIGIERLAANLKKIVSKNCKVRINIVEVKNPDLNASLLADFIVDQLESRTPFRNALKQALQRSKLAKAGGIKIQISGRLNGVEMARREWVKEGRIPLQTLRASIDYSAKEAKTVYGLLGIKIWLFKDEVLTKL